MRLLKADGDDALIELTLGELIIVNNALNEVCNGLELAEFATRMGAQRDEVSRLLRDVQDAIRAVEGQAASEN